MKKLSPQNKRHNDKKARAGSQPHTGRCLAREQVVVRRAGRKRRRGAQTWALLLALLLPATSSGCRSNLQRSYVDSMKATHKAVMADVKAGLYKPDDSSKRTLDAWAKANDDAEAALAAEGK